MQSLPLAALALFGLALAPLSARADKLKLHDGKWEITVQMQMPGMGNLPPIVHRQCLTQKDFVPKGHQ
ncbi:MAG: DUF3617 family protein [Myxococcales bacterium]|nr:DUF3617 family protein [Myxococcales bacterium]